MDALGKARAAVVVEGRWQVAGGSSEVHIK